MNNDIKQDTFVQGFMYKEDELACKQAFIEGGKWMAQQIYNAIKTMVENNDVWMH